MAETYNFKEIGASEAEEHIKMTYELASALGFDPIEANTKNALNGMKMLERLENMGLGDCDAAERWRGYLSRFD
jgi:hypothetical protein